MLKYYFHTLRSFWFLLFIGTTLLTTASFQFSDKSIPVDYWIIVNHSITMFANNAFLLYSYVRTEALSRVKNLIIIRKSERTTVNELIKIAIIDLTVYFTGTYFLVLLLNLSNIVAPLQCFIFLLMNLFLFLVYESIFMLIIMEHIPLICTLVPFALNILFHYTLVPIIFYQ